MHKSSFQELKVLALSKRGAGGLTFEFRDLRMASESPEPVADDFVTSFGFKPIGKAWRIVKRSEPLDTIFCILYRDLAYQRPLMDQKTARFIAESFLHLFFPYSGKYCTNGSLDERNMLGWTPITASTSDHGIVAFDQQQVGIVWVQDED
jgi:hypothetical protein